MIGKKNHLSFWCKMKDSNVVMLQNLCIFFKDLSRFFGEFTMHHFCFQISLPAKRTIQSVFETFGRGWVAGTGKYQLA